MATNKMFCTMEALSDLMFRNINEHGRIRIEDIVKDPVTGSFMLTVSGDCIPADAERVGVLMTKMPPRFPEQPPTETMHTLQAFSNGQSTLIAGFDISTGDAICQTV